MKVEKLAQLARIELNQTEQKELQKDIEAILNFVSKLKELPVEEVEGSSHILEQVNSFREDESEATEAIRKPTRLSDSLVNLIDQAPKKEKGYIKVKNIF